MYPPSVSCRCLQKLEMVGGECERLARTEVSGHNSYQLSGGRDISHAICRNVLRQRCHHDFARDWGRRRSEEESIVAITEPREVAWPGYPPVQSGLSSLIFVTDNRAADWGLGSLTPLVRSSAAFQLQIKSVAPHWWFSFHLWLSEARRVMR